MVGGAIEVVTFGEAITEAEDFLDWGAHGKRRREKTKNAIGSSNRVRITFGETSFILRNK